MNENETTWVAITNPTAGGGRCRRRAEQALDDLAARGINIVRHTTDHPGHASELAAQATQQGHTHLIALGGDGTTFEVLNGALRKGGAVRPDSERVKIAILPLGTGNSFLRDFDATTETVVEAITHARTRPCDVARIAHRDGETFALNLVSVGFVADICTTANRRFKRLGQSSYALGVIFELARLRPVVIPVSVDGVRDDSPMTFLSINNSQFTGGSMHMAPDANTSDGMLNLVRVGPLSRGALLRTFPKIFRGTHTQHPAITSCGARAVTFHEASPLDVMIDGEVVRLALTSIEVVPHAIDLVV